MNWLFKSFCEPVGEIKGGRGAILFFLSVAGAQKTACPSTERIYRKINTDMVNPGIGKFYKQPIYEVR